MRCFSALLVACCAGWAGEIPQGSHTLLRVVNSVSTRTAQEGDFIYFRTATPIVHEGSILVPAESHVQGVVTRSVRSGRVKGKAELGIRIESLTLPSGKVVKLSPTLASVDGAGSDQKVVGKENQVKQGGDHGADAVKIAGLSAAGAGLGGIADNSWKGAGIGAAVGSAAGVATVLLTRGKEVELRQGSTLDVVFDRAVPIE